MGWATTINGVTLNKIYADRLDEAKENAERELKWTRDQLLMMAALSPTETAGKDDDGLPSDPVCSIPHMIDEVLEERDNAVFRLHLIEQIDGEYTKIDKEGSDFAHEPLGLPTGEE